MNISPCHDATSHVLNRLLSTRRQPLNYGAMHRTTAEKLVAVGQAARPATLQLKFIRQRETFANLRVYWKAIVDILKYLAIFTRIFKSTSSPQSFRNSGLDHLPMRLLAAIES
jgi:hypothetical protein